MRSLLACLGDRSRFRVVASLLDGEACVTELAARVGLSQSCTTRHLQALAREGVVLRTRQGKRVVFRVRDDDPRVAALIEWAMQRAGAPATMPHEVHADAVSRYLVPVRRPASRADRPHGKGRTSTSLPPTPEHSSTRGENSAPTVPAPSPSYTVPDSTSSLVEPDSPRERFVEAPTPPRQEPAPLDRTELEDYLL